MLPPRGCCRPTMSQTNSANEAAKIARGGLLLTGTKLWFLAASYAIYFAIPRLATDGDSILGQFKAAGAWLSILSTVLVQGTTQAVSRYVGANPGCARALRGRVLWLQLALGGSLSALYWFAAPWIAGDDAALVQPLRVSATIPLIYSLYAVLLGILNGARAFSLQAAVDGSFTTAKVVLVCLGIWITGTAAGAYAGFAASALFVLIAAWFASRRVLARQDCVAAPAPRVGEFLGYQVQTVAFMMAVQWLVQMDLWYVQWFLDCSGAARDSARALYSATQLFAQIPYSLVIAVTLVLFPLVSATAAAATEQTRRYVREALRWALIIVATTTVVLVARPEPTLGLLLKDSAAHLAQHPDAASGLSWLGAGYVGFALFFLLCSTLNAAGAAVWSVVLALGVAGVQLVLSMLLLPRFGLAGQGMAGCIAMLAGCAAAFVCVGRRFGNVLPLATVVRVALAAAAVAALAHVIPSAGLLGTVLRFCACGGSMLAALVLLGEFGREDREKLARMLGRKQR